MIAATRFITHQGVIDSFPEKQGLKLEFAYTEGYELSCHWLISRKTRIETIEYLKSYDACLMSLTHFQKNKDWNALPHSERSEV